MWAYKPTDSVRVRPVHRFPGLILILALLGCLLAACTVTPPSTLTASAGLVMVDPVFQAFYNSMGGERILGNAISQVYVVGDAKYQFTDAALLVWDPRSPANQRFYLAPLGKDLNIPESANQPGAAGQEIIAPFAEFAALYEKMGGLPFVGQAMTGIRYNPEKKRYEQYFENVGFYRLEGESKDQVRLLAYGAWKCDHACRSTAPANSLVAVHPEIDPIFQERVARLGVNFTGFPLTEAYLADDGQLEQVFENVVLVANRGEALHVRLRDVPEQLGILAEPLVLADNRADLYFFPVQDTRGHNVPKYFLDFIAQHGGFELCGAPISEANQKENGGSRQCFTNLCLGYDPAASEGLSVRPESLGYSYKVMAYRPIMATPANGSGRREISMQVWESQPLLASGQEQEIGVILFENDRPLPNAMPVLTLTLPDGRRRDYPFSPSGPDGKTRLKLPPFEAANGVIFPYQICLAGQSGDKFCVKDSFLIWESP